MKPSGVGRGWAGAAARRAFMVVMPLLAGTVAASGATAGSPAQAAPDVPVCAAEASCAPSAVLARVLADMAAGRPQPEAVDAALPGMRPGPYDEGEELAFAELLFLDFKPAQALPIFSKHLKRTDLVGRLAWQRVMQMKFRAFDQPAEVAEMLPTFRARFAYDPADRGYDASQIINFAQARAAAGDAGAAASMITEAVRAAPFDGPYTIHLVPVRLGQIYAAAGRAAEARQLVETSAAGLQQALDARLARGPTDAEEAAMRCEALPAVICVNQGWRPGQQAFSIRNAQYAAMIQALRQALGPAPAA
ncbi:MAG TPA: hypothetical protein VFF48_01610 [Brevundimonas sp.]|nr:hypothetical protein [Brevundimonas sp.]